MLHFSTQTFCFHKADYEKIDVNLSQVNWNFSNSDGPRYEIVDALCTRFEQVISEKVARFCTTTKPFIPWFNNVVDYLVNLKRKCKKVSNNSTARHWVTKNLCLRYVFLSALL